jgi:hypothetical protein
MRATAIIASPDAVCAPRFFYGVTLGEPTIEERIDYPPNRASLAWFCPTDTTVNIEGRALGAARPRPGSSGSSIWLRPKGVGFAAFRAMAPINETDVFLTKQFWRRG